MSQNATPARPQPHGGPTIKANINMATLNVNGLSAPTSGMNFIQKWSMINATLNEHKLAMLAIQESHLDQDTVDLLRQRFGDKMEIIFSADPDAPRATAGVAFILNKKRIAPRQLSVHELIPGRALFLKIKWHESESTSIVNVYAPTDKLRHPQFWETILNEHSARRLTKPDFMLGDFNITEDPIDRIPVRPDDNQAAITALRDLRLAWDLEDTWRHLNPQGCAYTYRATANGQPICSRLDRIYISKRISPLTFDWKITQSAVPTDHWLVGVKYAPNDAPSIGKGRWTWPLHTLSDEKLLEAVNERSMRLQDDIDHLELNTIERSTSNPQLLWHEYKRDIAAIAKSHTRNSYHKIGSRIKRLEMDRKSLTDNPNFQEDSAMILHEAFLTSELEHLERVKARQRRDVFRARLTDHGEKLGGVWSALSKESKPRDLIYRLKVPNSNPPQYERDSTRMAELSQDFHDGLQKEDIMHFDDPEEHERLLLNAIDAIPASQFLSEPHMTTLNWPVTEAQVSQAIDLGKNKTATGLDGLPYELWKALKMRHESLLSHPHIRSFDLTRTLTKVFADIQTHGVDPNTNFAHAWMCPAFKKKDPTEIGNYRPISILNTDYKLFTKLMALQLNDHAHALIHSDQAGFVPRRSIFNHIRLAKAIINYAEQANDNGSLILLDQEKAYDKIRHDYLWRILEAFHLPRPFINSLKALYEHAYTRVAINGVLSSPFQVYRGVRQGDPLSCPIFNLAIEPLACLLRKSPTLRGFQIPGLTEKLITKVLADDMALFLSLADRFDHVRQILCDWCQVSGAKFNIEKTEIIPIGSVAHRAQVIASRKINPLDQHPFESRIRIAADTEAVRYLGAWLGNKVDESTPWEPVVSNISKALTLWEKAHPSMVGRKLIVQTIIGGYTQFLTKAQGMPDTIVTALTKIIREFVWKEDSSPRIALDLLHCPRENGGLGLLDIKARNEAIEIVWLKSYLNFSPSRPEWAVVTDLILAATASTSTAAVIAARQNPFLQTWNAPVQGSRVKKLNNDIIRMLKTARKYKANLAAIRVSFDLQSQLPVWYHLASISRPITDVASRCLLYNHGNKTVGDMLRTSARLHTPNASPWHLALPGCPCSDCQHDRSLGCSDPHHCASEALLRIHNIFPKLNPLRLGDPHDNLSLTRRRKALNRRERERKGEILFDPSITCKDSLAECFRIFTDPSRLTKLPAQRFYTVGVRTTARTLTVYTDGACFNNGKHNARCGSGVYFGPNDVRNCAFRPPGDLQSNQAAELIAIYKAVSTVPKFIPLRIVTDSLYAINGLTQHLSTWEDNGWIGIKNASLFRLTASVLKQRTAPTTFQWIKGHSDNIGNEEADRLAKEGAIKPTTDTLHLDIQREFDLQGAKLSTITQSLAYQGIRELSPPWVRPTTSKNIRLVRESLAAYHHELETDETIWKGLQNRAIRTRVRQFLFKAMHGTQKIGKFWSRINFYEDRADCSHCNIPETMEHILLHCPAGPADTIWQLAENLWPHTPHLWPPLNLGILLGCGSIHTPLNPLPHAPQIPNDPPQRPRNHKGATRLLQILLSESLHLIWVLRCERAIQAKTHSRIEIRKRWFGAINARLAEDRIIATKIKRDATHLNLIKATWKPALTAHGTPPNTWPFSSEVFSG